MKTTSIQYGVYIVECSDGSLYTGWTTDITRRIREHNDGNRGAKYTRGRRPVILVHHELYDTESDARKRECTIKRMTRREKIALIQSKKES